MKFWHVLLLAGVFLAGLAGQLWLRHRARRRVYRQLGIEAQRHRYAKKNRRAPDDR